MNKEGLIIGKSRFSLRPKCSDSEWLMFLLPIGMIISCIKHPTECTQMYKLCTTFSISLLFAGLPYSYLKQSKNRITLLWYLTTMVFMSIIYAFVWNKGLLHNLFATILSHEGFSWLYLGILRICPKSFSLGEATIVTQGILIFIYSTVLNLVNAAVIPPNTNMTIATLLIQFGVIGVVFALALIYNFEIFRRTIPFYVLSVFSIVFFVVIPSQLFLEFNPVIWIFSRIESDSNLLKLFVYWGICCCIAAATINWKIKTAQKASTTIRKIFHVLLAAVFIPGLINQCSFLYLSTGVTFCILIYIETLRELDVPPLGQHLQHSFLIFADKKDAGPVALTPIYLLVGCSLPLWLHPAPCDVTESAGFNVLPVLSGVLSIGIGDTVASAVGSRFGKFKWPGGHKTVEGTLGCIFSQVAAVVLLSFLDLPFRVDLQVYVAIIVTSLVEANTDQIDNLVLPLIMYSILC